MKAQFLNIGKSEFGSFFSKTSCNSYISQTIFQNSKMQTHFIIHFTFQQLSIIKKENLTFYLHGFLKEDTSFVYLALLLVSKLLFLLFSFDMLNIKDIVNLLLFFLFLLILKITLTS